MALLEKRIFSLVLVAAVVLALAGVYAVRA